MDCKDLRDTRRIVQADKRLETKESTQIHRPMGQTNLITGTTSGCKYFDGEDCYAHVKNQEYPGDRKIFRCPENNKRGREKCLLNKKGD